MKKLFTLFAFVATSMTALPNETFYVTDAQGLEVCYEMLDTPGEVSFNGNTQWGNSASSCPESVIVPSSVMHDGTEYKVTEIGSSACAYAGVTSVTLSEGLKGIGYKAFSGSGIKGIALPESVEWLADGRQDSGVFSYCENLEKVQLSKNLKEIPGSTFYRCESLAEITIPEGVTNIGNWAFFCCSALKTVAIPGTVTSIGNQAFSYCDGLETVQLSANLVELSYRAFSDCGSLSSVVIPAGVKCIQSCCFYNCPSLSKVSLPDGLQNIEFRAFSGCQQLQEIDLPSSVENIKGLAFEGTSLKNVTLPSSLCEIASDAFSETELANLYIDESNEYYACIDGVLYNKAVTELVIYPINNGDTYTIPATITSIDIPTLSGLSHINVAPGNKTFSALDDVLYNIDGTILLLYTDGAPKAFVMPATVISVGEMAFKGKQVESVVLNEGLQVIGEEAFRGASISGVHFPSTLVEIGHAAFCESSLEEVNIPSTVKTISGDSFNSCHDLKTVVIGDTESAGPADVVIGSYAFANSENISTIILGTCVKEIGNQAFVSIDNPDRIVFSEGLERIGREAFYSRDPYRVNTYPTEDFTLPSTLQYIGGYAFASIKFPKVTCYAVTPPEFGGSLPIQGTTLVVYENAESEYNDSNWVFYFKNIQTMEKSGVSVGETFEADGIYYVLGDNECYVTQSPEDAPYTGEVNIPDEVSVNGTTVAVTKVLAAFVGTEGMTSLTIPGTVTEIERGAFLNCPSLTSLRFEYGEAPLFGLEKHGRLKRWAFQDSPVVSLYIDRDFVEPAITFNTVERMEFGDHVECVSSGICEGSPLLSLKLGASIEDIGQRAFYNTQIAEITLPETLRSIGAYAFYGTKIENLFIPGNVETIFESAFASCPNLVKVVFDDNVTTIGDFSMNERGAWLTRNIFFDCQNLSEVQLPASLKVIGPNIFSRCPNLKHIDLPDGLEAIGPSAFSGTGFTELDVPGSVKWIGARAIESPLESITLHEGLERLDVGAIVSSKLTKIEIPSTVQYLNRITTRELYGHHTTDYWGTAIAGLTKLEEVVIGPENPYFTVVDGVIYSKDMTSLVGCLPTKEGSLDIPESVTKVERYALARCSLITGVNLPSELKVIEPAAFNGCALETLTIPASVEVLGGFFVSWGLKDLHVQSPTPIDNFVQVDDWDAIVPADEMNIPEDITLYVPKGSLDIYLADEYWNKFIEIIGEDPLTGITDIPAVQTEDTEYYDLNGVKVNSPKRGLYITRSGKKVIILER